jgi:hypothetical protein
MATRHRWNLLRAAPAAALLMLGTSCSKEEPPPVPPAPADTAPQAPASRLDEVSRWDATRVDEGNHKDLLGLADALASEAAPEARAASVRLRLIAVAALAPKPPAGFDVSAQLALALTQAAQAGVDADRLALTARMLEMTLGAEDPAKPAGEAFDGSAALALLDGPGAASIEADLVRLTARRALQELDRLSGDTQDFAAFARRYGAFACPVCAAAGDVTGAADAVVPCPAGDTSPTCAVIAALAGQLPVASEAPNRVVIALVERLSAVADQALSHKGLARSVELPVRPLWIGLPVQLERAQLPVVGGAPTPAGFSTSEPRLVATVTPAGVGLGHRAKIGPGGTSPVIEERRLASQFTAPWATLAAPPAPAARGAPESPPDLRARLVSLIPDGPAPEEVTVLVGLRPQTRASDAGVALDALRQLNLRHFRFAGAPASSPIPVQSPLLVRELPPALAALPEAAPGSVVRVAVHPTHVDVWGPERDAPGADGKPGVTAARAAVAGDVPAGLEQGWRGEVLARLRIPLQPPAEATPPAAPAEPGQAAPPQDPPQAVSPRLDDAAREAVLAAVAFFRQKTGAGAFVHVSAAPELSAGAVVDLARAVQHAPLPAGATPNPAAKDPGSLWLGTRCEGPDSCPGTLALAFSTSPVPGDRGLTPRPGEAATADEKPPTVAIAPPPSEENCDRSAINAVMRRATGRFRFCYEKELQLTKDLAGKASVSFTIGLDGKVSGVSTGGDLPSKAVLECLGREVGKLAFPAPANGACQIRWPFVFKPE